VSKLLKLREWLTVEDAAKQLSIMFGEEFTEADVLRLALDGRLTLSVQIVNSALVRPGLVVSKGEAKYIDVPFNEPSPSGDVASGRTETVWRKVPVGIPLVDGDVIELTDEVDCVGGIFDLPMIGNERRDVEARYQRLTGGPTVTWFGMGGAFLAWKDEIFQLQISQEKNEHAKGSLAWGRKLEAAIEREALDAHAAGEMRAQHEADRVLFLRRWARQSPTENHMRADALPSDCVLVVRSSALRELQTKMSEEDPYPQPNFLEKGLNLGQEKEDRETRQRRRFDRFSELGGKRPVVPGQRAGKHGALAELAREEKEAGRSYSDQRDVAKDLDAEVERRRFEGTLPRG